MVGDEDQFLGFRAEIALDGVTVRHDDGALLAALGFGQYVFVLAHICRLHGHSSDSRMFCGLMP
ncbi:hypothetical protein D3C85_1886360 [compost metagenome]